MQRKLSQWATEDPTKRFVDLYSLLCNEQWLRVAAHETLQNKGSETAGIDGKTKSNFLGDLDGYVKQHREALKAKTFGPMPVRRVYIPKLNSEKKRPLGIPTLLDRIVQDALRMILELIWEADFSIHSYGFRPNRSTKERIKRESLFSYDSVHTREDRPREGELREEVLLRDGPICAWCKKEFNPFEVQVDHIKPRARFKNPEDTDHIDNMQVLCTEHHRAKTKTDLKVLSRVR